MLEYTMNILNRYRAYLLIFTWVCKINASKPLSARKNTQTVHMGLQRPWKIMSTSAPGLTILFLQASTSWGKKSTSFRKLWERLLSKLWHTPLGKIKDRAKTRQHIYSECAFWMKDLARIKSLPSAKVFQWNPGSKSKGLSGFRSQITSISNTVAREAAQTPRRLAPHRTQTNSFAFLSTQHH